MKGRRKNQCTSTPLLQCYTWKAEIIMTKLVLSYLNVTSLLILICSVIWIKVAQITIVLSVCYLTQATDLFNPALAEWCLAFRVDLKWLSGACYKASRYKTEAWGPYELLLPLLLSFMQMFLFTKWRVVLRLCLVRRYFKQPVVYYLCEEFTYIFIFHLKYSNTFLFDN
jgi:hypothetical protein